jgi:hypothetical protein
MRGCSRSRITALQVYYQAWPDNNVGSLRYYLACLRGRRHRVLWHHGIFQQPQTLPELSLRRAHTRMRTRNHLHNSWVREVAGGACLLPLPDVPSDLLSHLAILGGLGARWLPRPHDMPNSHQRRRQSQSGPPGRRKQQSCHLERADRR